LLGIFRYAIATGRADYDRTQARRGAFARVVVCNRPASIEPVRIGELRSPNGRNSTVLTRCGASRQAV